MNEQSYRERPTTETGLQFSIEVGNESFEPGFSRFVVNEDGSVLVTNVLEGKERRFEGQIGPEQAGKLIEQARSAQALSNPEIGRKMGLPDEPRYHFVIYQEGREALDKIVWRSELESDPDMAELLNRVQEITQRISDGSVIL